MRKFFGLEEDWERPSPGQGWWWPDAGTATVLFVLSAIGMEMLRAIGSDLALSHDRWQQYLCLASASLVLLWRRKAPVAVLAFLLGPHITIAEFYLPELLLITVSQILYFTALVSAFAWSRNRQKLLICTAFVLALQVGVIIWQFAIGNALAEFIGRPTSGIVDPVVAVITWASVYNMAYYIGAIIFGQILWNKARANALIEEQTRIMVSQSEDLARHAVLNERLRIARDLHDIVAHHVSVIGIQAAAARRAIDRQPESLARSLQSIEQSSRDAVNEMRMVLTTLRAEDEPTRNPVPTIAQIPILIAEARNSRLKVDYSVVDPEDLLSRTPASTQTTLYRAVQEAITNVRKHSTATSATVVLRSGEGTVEAEVTDSGRPRSGTSGTGFGLRGLIERVQTCGGHTEIGPRPSGGFRVRVTLPAGQNT